MSEVDRDYGILQRMESVHVEDCREPRRIIWILSTEKLKGKKGSAPKGTAKGTTFIASQIHRGPVLIITINIKTQTCLNIQNRYRAVKLCVK